MTTKTTIEMAVEIEGQEVVRIIVRQLVDSGSCRMSMLDEES